MGEHISNERLSAWAKEETAQLSAGGFIPGTVVAGALRRSIAAIKRTAARAAEQSEDNRVLPQVYEWLLDNRYLCQREGQDAYAALKNTPRLPGAGGCPYVYMLAQILTRSGQGRVTPQRMTLFLTGAQAVRSLSEGELWLFVPMLRAALLAEIALICRKLDSMPKEGGAPVGEEEGAEEDSPAALSSRMGALVTSLRTLSVTDVTKLMQEQSAAEQALCRDPAGLYPLMDEDSRGQYRDALSRLSRKRGQSEMETAQQVLTLCQQAKEPADRHVGRYLLDKPLGKAKGRWGWHGYFWVFALLTGCPAALCAWLLGQAWVGLLLLLPLSAMAKNCADALATRLTPCRPVPRMALPDGIPKVGKTLCVISVMLTDTVKAGGYAARMESYYHANRDKNLLFGLLCDLPDSKEQCSETDRAILAEAARGVRVLNQKYGGGFYLFTRPRQWHPKDKKFMGWERKRGAIVELCRLLRDLPAALTIADGDKNRLDGVRYIITLDADTQLTPGSARLMVGSMLHPANYPRIDPDRRVVCQGYGLLTPRLTTGLEAAGKSLFSRIFAGQGGLDPYGGMAGEVYHDLFNRGSYTGKGIFDVDVFLTCLDGRFPENRILSHDLLEGAYLGTGLLEDVELSDGYPAGFLPWAQRLHRWTRGDWQAAGWMLPFVPGAAGSREKNPLDGVSRFKLFDPLRRSLVPVATLAALTAGVLLPGKTLVTVFIVTLVSAVSHLLVAALETLLNPRAGRTRYHAAIITGFRAVLYQTVLLLLFLPYQALLSLHAMAAALWRVTVSRRKLLEWVTSAETESYTFGTVVLCRKMFPGLVWGVLTACLARTWGGWLLGAFWAASPFVAYAVSRVNRKTIRLSENDRGFLHHQAALMWEYFDTFLTREDHFLIPDNWQEQPAAGIAHRSSPTNIGLSLLCVLTAADLGLCGRERALRLIDGVLSSLETLPKWHGHIYNWYDTRTLEPLLPRCVSTVDSGNLCGCLIALRQGLDEWEDAAAQDLSDRAGKLADGMDFRPLYDADRRLFVISRDMERPDTETGYYDLLASEARQTSYIAVARGEVDKKHWQRLGRAQTALGRFRGMASWTGTMFEYFMPHLLLPVYDNSLLRESLDFAVYAQREQAARRGGPWGVSESCFYAFDPALNYQYKAHGIPALAFKRGLGKDWVISPYSSYLSLLTHPNASVKNLRRLHAMGLEGQYGLIEAADYTPTRRTSAQRPYEEVRCYMSHHLGMSLVAVGNALRDNIMQRRFMRDAAMGAFNSLLQERVPVGAATIRGSGREVPEKPPRAENDNQSREYTDIHPDTPRAVLLGNAAYTLLCTDGGLTASGCRGMALTRFEPRVREGACGMRFFFVSEAGAVSLLPAPDFTRLERYSTVMESGRVIWRYEGDDLSSHVSAIVPDNENAEKRTVTLCNRSKEPLRGELCCYFEPVLQAANDYNAHPAFSKLFLETRIEGAAVLVRRRPRGNNRENWLCFACDRADVRYDTSRELALGRGGQKSLPMAMSRPPGDSQGAVLDPCVLARIPVTLAAEETVSVGLVLAESQTAADARSAALRICRMKEPAVTGRAEAIARQLSLSPAEYAETLSYLPHLVFPLSSPYRDNDPQLEKAMGLGVQGLWAMGISGDYPILLAYAGDQTSLDRLSRAIRQHRLLARCGFACDLCIIGQEGSDYRRPIRTFVMETLKTCRAESSLGARGGVHLVDLKGKPAESEHLLRGLARLVIGEALPAVQRLSMDILPPFPAETQPTDIPAFDWQADGSFRFDTSGALPPLAWSHVLSNRGFGALVTECGTGYSFCGNARENKLTPWKNDALAVSGGVSLMLETEGHAMSLFAAQDRLPCLVTYGLGWAQWEKRTGTLGVRTTQFVPPNRMALCTLLEVEGCREDICLHYNGECLLGDGPSMGRTVRITRREAKTVTAENPLNTAFAPQTFVLAASEEVSLLPARPGVLAATVKLSRGTDGVYRVVLVTGSAGNDPGVGLLEALAESYTAAAALEETKAYWRKLCLNQELAARPQDRGPEAALRHYLGGPALYQVIAVRLFGRTSLYQCGGAYGFRDQLQDSCAALQADHRLTRTQILRACAHQYLEGDVMHWWHPLRNREGFQNKGVRTHCSDDLLWLPYTLCEYLVHTGDRGLLDQTVPFLRSEPLPVGAHDRYETAVFADERGTVYDHACRAVDLVLRRGTGAHGLLLMGTGDWNDGMNLVGAKGRGESVWLTWFCAHVLERMAPVCAQTGDRERHDRYREWADTLIAAGAEAWDGEWFLRGYYDDGSTLGSERDAECKIDAIAQSFAALFPGKVPPERVRRALESARARLCDKERRLIRVLTPAFGQGEEGTEEKGKLPQPGYIKGYLPGVRENGGQYTHAAIWLAMGFMRAGDPESCRELLHLLLPETHDPAVYKAEPYMLAADVYSHPLHIGRGGWSLYTGAASWYYRVAREMLERTQATAEPDPK